MSRSRVSYPKDLRERAEKDGKKLVTVDADVHGCRHTLQSLATPVEAGFIVWASMAMRSLPEARLKELATSLRIEIERHREAQEVQS